MKGVVLVYFLSLCTLVTGLCLFDNHHKKSFKATSTEILETIHVRGAAQCKRACAAYEGECSAVNLRFSKNSADYICELLNDGIDVANINLFTTDFFGCSRSVKNICSKISNNSINFLVI